VIVPIPAAKQRIVLAALLAQANQVVSLDGLAEAIWGADPTPSARATIRNYVRRLRQILGDTQGLRIVTRDPGYLVEVSDDDCDLLAFTRLYRRGLAAATAGAWQEATDVLQSALLLWRGEPLADVLSPVLCDREIPRLTGMRLRAVETSIEAQLRLGRSAEVLADLERLVVEHPLRERLHAQLMLALYRCARQADALAAYRTTRLVLAEEVGVEPGPELRQLHARILRNDPDLLPPVEPAESDRAVLTTGAVPETVVPYQLPPAIPRISGRVAELKVLSSMVGSPQDGPTISVISGSAGVGKTTLALRWAHDAAEHFPDGLLYADLGGFSQVERAVSPEETIRQFLDVFNVPVNRIPKDLTAQSALYRSLLATKRVLVVLDNARNVGQVRPLLPAGSACRAVVTSRSPLVGLVAVEGARPVHLDVLSDDEARELLNSRLGVERTGAEPDAITALTRLCGGLPLALSIVAARAAARPKLPLASLLSQLRDERRRLDALDAGDPTTSVRSVFSWSYRGLSASAAHLFRMLGLHVGTDVSVMAAASLAGTPVVEAHRALGELADAHMVLQQTADQYGLHDLLRVYATDRATAEEDEPARHAAVRRLLDHYLLTADGAVSRIRPHRKPVRPLTPAPGTAVTRLADADSAAAWLQIEHGNLMAAVASAATLGFDEHAWQLPSTLTLYLDSRALWHDWLAMQRTATAAARRLADTDAVAHTLRGLGNVSLRLGRPADAATHYGQALRLYEQLGDPVGQAHSHRGLSEAQEKLGHNDLAMTHSERALALYVEGGDLSGQAHAYNDLGWMLCMTGDYAGAIPCCHRALDLHARLGDRVGEGFTWGTLGLTHQRLGEYDEAIRCYWQNIHLLEDQGERFHYYAGCLELLAECYQILGNLDAARDCLRQALVVYENLHRTNAKTVRARLEELA
jgi:DNA-binding SARP family transcriptional activator/tetratricopeptide (TPR) repeat protein